jgi:hypothetical protein
MDGRVYDIVFVVFDVCHMASAISGVIQYQKRLATIDEIDR